jgi:predicted metalloprotease
MGKKACLRNVLGRNVFGRTVTGTVTLLVLIAVGGCGILTTTSTVQPGDSAGAQGAPPAGAVDLAHGGQVMKPPAGFTCPNQTLRGCFSESQMVTYYEYVLPYVDEFFTQTWPSLALPQNVYFIPDGVTIQQQCVDANGGHTATDMAYQYCPADHNVYVGQQLAWALYSQAGDVAPAIGIAHEFGHNVQTLVGVPAPQDNAQTLVHENQADCVAGSWLGYANNHHLLMQSDVPVIEKLLELISSGENIPNRTHGDFAERGGALKLGGEQGISACNSFYPATPIH